MTMDSSKTRVGEPYMTFVTPTVLTNQSSISTDGGSIGVERLWELGEVRQTTARAFLEPSPDLQCHTPKEGWSLRDAFDLDSGLRVTLGWMIEGLPNGRLSA